MQEGELPPLDASRRLPVVTGGQVTQVRKVRIMKRLRDEVQLSPESVRNRVVLMEMRRSYNQLAGVGDSLVDMRLAQYMSSRHGVSSLGRQDLIALNYDLAELASSIFGPSVAKRVYEHIGRFIQETFA